MQRTTQIVAAGGAVLATFLIVWSVAATAYPAAAAAAVAAHAAAPACRPG